MYEYDTQESRTLSRAAQRRLRKQAEREALPSVADMRPDQRANVMATLPAEHRRVVNDMLEARHLPDWRSALARIFLPFVGGACVVNDAIYAPTSAFNPDTSRTWENTIVRSKMGWEELRAKGHGYFQEDFQMVGNLNMSSAVAGSVGAFSAYGNSGTRINDANLEGGVVAMTPTGTTALGITLLSSTGSFRFLTTSTLALNKKMCFECRVAKTTITSAHICGFVGLMNPTLASGLPATAQPIKLTSTAVDTLMTVGDLFGFFLAGTTGNYGGPSDISVVYNLATNAAVINPTGLVSLLNATGQSALTASGFVTLGWVFDPNARPTYISSATGNQTVGVLRKPLIKFYVNNEVVPTFLSSDDITLPVTAAFPTSFMGPVMAVMSQASVGATDAFWGDWLYVGQDANS